MSNPKLIGSASIVSQHDNGTISKVVAVFGCAQRRKLDRFGVVNGLAYDKIGLNVTKRTDP